MGLFEIKIVGTMVAMAAGIFFVSVVLARDMLMVSTSMARKRSQELLNELRDTTVFYREMVATQRRLFQERAGKYSDEIEPGWKNIAKNEKKQFLKDLIDGDRELETIRILDADGKEVISVGFIDESDLKKWRVVNVKIPLPPGVLGQSEVEFGFIVSRDLEERYQRLGRLEMEDPHLKRLGQEIQPRYLPLLVRWFAISIGFVTLFGLFLTRRITRRVTRLSVATTRVAEGDLSFEVPVKSRDEIGNLAADFNKMVRQIRQSRAQIQYLQKISAWQEIARRLAHEIKNPLTPIRLAIEQVHDTYEGGDERFAKVLHDVYEIIHEEVSNLQQMVEEFSAFAKLPDVSPQKEHVDDLMDEFSRTAGASFPQATIICKPVKPGLTMLVDIMMFRRVLHNLVLNAVQACEENSVEPVVELRARFVEKERLVEWRVDDNGPGIADDLKERVFDPYFTTKEGGTGLGLAIVKKILLEHLGSINVENSHLGGAGFVMEFPSTHSDRV